MGQLFEYQVISAILGQNFHQKAAMSQTEFYIYCAILLGVIFILSILVAVYYQRFQLIKKAKAKLVADMTKNEQERLSFVSESLRTIALAFVQNQVEASEACIRLRMLIDRYEFIRNEDYPYIFSMYEKIKHFKTHETRNAMSKTDRFEEDKSRFKIEQEFEAALIDECQKLLTELKQQ